ncbi:MAG: hypothetical protein IJM18_07320 [Clostridia bacterium]|nr:hypothetical protein [Clostridia bacterium]
MKTTKRTFARFFALMLIAAMLLAAAAACKKQATDAELIVGKWTATVDLASFMRKQLDRQQPEDEFSKKMMENIDVEGLGFKMNYEFEADGKCKGSVEEESVNAMIKDLGAKFAEAAKAADTDGTYEAWLAAAGMSSWDDFGALFAEAMNTGDIDFNAMSGEGTYKLEDGNIKFFDENGELEETVKYSLSDGELKFESIERPDMDEDQAKILEEMLPFVFKKN